MNTKMNVETESLPFLHWLNGWLDARPTADLRQLIFQAGGPQNVAVLSVDMIAGFCTTGPLASPRVQALAAPISRLMTAAYETGIRDCVLAQDSHPPDSPEFHAFPPHCVAGTAEAETVPEFQALPFFREMAVHPKQSLSAFHGTNLDSWLRDRPHLTTFIVVGDCTDLCTYNLALGLRLRANAAGEHPYIVVPTDCVDTYDLPLETAQSLGALPHPGDTLHAVFLYHLALNGVHVVKTIE